ncbi:iron complex transport system substrate-binding protein [Orbus hercynius]|uniref:Iron complex transport system substrate-binding protein n=1 Tax=Orbus hercynius TaxID=593135 RepID=A0A495RJY0_9GAMM|nr:ABC transporter substrate-binding protein [Orbus hercynius]RKS87745.1 iron complex transport system substrate-binding protein [Orbus hercynius]
MIYHLRQFIIITLTMFAPLSYSQERIIIAGGSITEIIYLLQAQDELVGVDMTSTYPPEVKSLPQIGYWKQLSIEGILSLKPTLFITWQDSGPSPIFAQLATADVDILSLQRVPNDLTLLFSNIEKIGDRLHKSEQAKQLISAIASDVAIVEDKIVQEDHAPNVLFLLSMSGVTQVAGKNTVADSLITLAGGNNIATHNNYKNYSSEALIVANPDVIVVTSQSIDAIGGIENLAQFAGVNHTNAWKNKRIVLIDQALILGMGPRVGQAVNTLYAGFYP